MKRQKIYSFIYFFEATARAMAYDDHEFDAREKTMLNTDDIHCINLP